jgi:hypothetical protein
VDFTQERREIIRAYDSAMENPHSAEQIGKSVAGLGDAIYKTAGSYQQQQEELQTTAAKAEYEGLSSSVMADVQSSLDTSNPHTFQGVLNQKWQQVDDWYKAQPVNVQRAVYPKYVHDRYMNQAAIGMYAHKTQIANETNTTLGQIQQAQNSWDYGTAYELADRLASSGAIPANVKNSLYKDIEASKATNTIQWEIQQNPSMVWQKLDAARAGDFNRANAYMQGLSDKELHNYQEIADRVSTYQQNQAGQSFYSMIDDGSIKTLDQLQNKPGYAELPEKWRESVKSKLLHEVVGGSPEGIKAYGEALGRVVALRTSNQLDLIKDYGAVVQMAGALPKHESAEVLKEAEEIYRKRMENGGSLPYNEKIASRVSDRLYKMYSEDLTWGDPSSDAAITSYKQAEADWQKVVAENPNSAAEAEQKFWELRKIDAAKSILMKDMAKKPGGLLNSIWDWTTGAKPQASNDPGAAAGKVTSYGYEGDQYGGPDAKASNMGAFNNPLTDKSLAVSPDIQARFKEAGIKPMEPVELTLEDGTKVVRHYDDHTASDQEARKLGLKPLRGRFDFRSVGGKQEKDGIRVVSFRKYTEDGQG